MVEINEAEKQRKKNEMRTTSESLWDNVKHPNHGIIGVTEEDD